MAEIQEKPITIDEAKSFVYNRTTFDGRFIMDYADSYKALNIFLFLIENFQQKPS